VRGREDPAAALDRTAPVLPLLPGTPQRATHDYTRHGVTNRYAALDVASGKVISQLTARHRAIEFTRFLDRVEGQVPAGLQVHVICDNSSTHKPPRSSGGWCRIPACSCTSLRPTAPG
jgi:DDE superfamily endonuclease